MKSERSNQRRRTGCLGDVRTTITSVYRSQPVPAFSIATVIFMAADNLRYPIGEFQFCLPFSTQERMVFLAQLAEAPAKLRTAVANLSEAQLDTPYRPDGWTIRQVVHHLPDSHLNWYIRGKLALTENEPTIKPFSEELWAQLSDGRSGAIEPSLRILEGIHARTALFFESLAPQDWTRKFSHPEFGALSIQDILPALAWHSRHHTAHITELRKRMGWVASKKD
jgi:hypothetical protein